MKPEWDKARNILCVRLDLLGDVLMTTPAIRALKHSVQGRQVTLLSSGSGAAVASYVPEIDDVIRYDAPWLKATPRREGSEYDRHLCDLLRDVGFDGAVIFTVFSQSPMPAALWCYLADIPLRVAHCRENPYHLLTDWIPEIEPENGIRHEVERQLELVGAIGCSTFDSTLSFRVPDQAKLAVEKMIVNARLELDGDWVVMHPGATAPSRRYPVEKFASVADGLSELGIQVVVTGDYDEAALIEQLQSFARTRLYSLAGQLNLGQMGALLQQAPLLISNNTGPVHLAAALGTPVVDIYALTNPQHGPWRVPHRVLNHDVPCKYCFKSICPEVHHDCLRRVTPESVIGAALSLLSETRPSSTRSRWERKLIEVV